MNKKRKLIVCLLVVGGVAFGGGCSKTEEDVTRGKAGEGAAESAEMSATCAAHGDPKALCFICDPALREKGRLWCSEHARYEDRCWLCHPELEEKGRLYCPEHSLYEDECFLCHPELLDAVEKEARGAGARLYCREHDLFEDECGICHPELAQGMKAGQELRVRLPGKQSAAKMGIEAERLGKARIGVGIECYAELAFDQRKVVRIAPQVSGLVTEIRVDLGSKVEEGEVLAALSSPEIARVQSGYLRALAELELRERGLRRESQLRGGEISSAREYEEAEALHRTAAAMVIESAGELAALGFSAAQVRQIDATREAAGALELRAPFAGEVVERSAVLGQRAGLGESLFTVADLSELWVKLALPESALAEVRVGQEIEVAFPALGNVKTVGSLDWISPRIDERTRMVEARAVVKNERGQLKAGMYGSARIVIEAEEERLALPASALQWIEGRSFAFVELGQGLYGARAVELGGGLNGKRVVLSGLREGERVVTGESFLLKSQFLISRLGAGCVDE